MITDRIGLHSVLLPVLITKDANCFSTNRRKELSAIRILIPSVLRLKVDKLIILMLDVVSLSSGQTAHDSR